jgi:hypothetical protein
MATVFKGASKAAITTVTTLYTAPAATASVVTGLVICNTTAVDATITVIVQDATGPTSANIAKNLPLPANSTIQVADNNTRIVLETGDLITLTATQACDAHVSVMEIS